MSGQRWFLVLSPDGAARSVSFHVSKAFGAVLGDMCKTFDTLTYRQAFQRLLDQRDENLLVDLINQSLIVSCLDFQPTHVLVNALSPVTLFSLNLLRKYNVTTVHWFFEDFRRAPYWLDVVHGYDHFCAIQRGPIPAACSAAKARYHFLPTACCCEGFTAPDGPRIYDVAFVGIPSRYRVTVLETLVQSGVRCAIAGSGWDAYRGMLEPMIVQKKWITDEEVHDVLVRSKIGINMSVEDPQKSEDVHISPRVYDILAAGCLLVSEDVPHLAESLPGAVYSTFTSATSACSAIQKLLDGYAGFGPAIIKNRSLILENHTYRNRIETLMKLAG